MNRFAHELNTLDDTVAFVHRTLKVNVQMREDIDTLVRERNAAWDDVEALKGVNARLCKQVVEMSDELTALRRCVEELRYHNSNLDTENARLHQRYITPGAAEAGEIIEELPTSPSHFESSFNDPPQSFKRFRPDSPSST